MPSLSKNGAANIDNKIRQAIALMELKIGTT